MQAIILAAGMGKRLGTLTHENTKSMVEVNGVRLIDRMLSQLENLKLSKIIIVIGYAGENLKSHIESSFKGHTHIEYITNPIYDKTNNIYSLYLAKNYLLSEDTILLESDLIFNNGILESIVESEYTDIALVAQYESWMDGTMITLDKYDNIISFIPKQLFDYSNISQYYKTVNIYKFSKQFSKNKYVPFLEAYSKAYGNNEYYEQVLRVLAMMDKGELKGLVLDKKQKWYEIDDIQDLDIAETLFAEDSERLAKYQRRYGGYWRFESLLDFCYLVNPYFPSSKMKDELKANFNNLLTQYPSGLNVNNLLAAKYFDIPQDYICIGNGAAELIKEIMTLSNGKIGMIHPTFEEYPNRSTKDNIVEYTPTNRDFKYNAENIISYFSDKNLNNLLLINPDNPSGNYIGLNELVLLINWTKEKNIQFIVDESFIDFSEEQATLLDTNILRDNPHLLVVKSISKSYGVPGLRLGVVATSNSEVLTEIKKNLSIWNINSFAEYYMQIFGKYAADYKKASILFIEERERFYKQLSELEWIRVVPSQANYFLCEVDEKYILASYLTEQLLNQFNILIKDCSGKTSFDNKNYVRIAIRDTHDNNLLVEALKQL